MKVRKKTRKRTEAGGENHNTRQRKIAAIHDLSGFGRCSLTVALPIISAMGMQCCPMPTALLSNHTGYPSFSFEDLTDQMEAFIAEWKKLGLRFDGIYSGFLGDEAQIAVVERFLKEFHARDSIYLCDPVLGDDGVAYKTCDEKLCGQMRRLAAQADVLTPNLTELALLSGCPYRADIDDESILRQIYRLADGRPVQIVVTGVVREDRILNFAYDGRQNCYEIISCEREYDSYSGTGDVFASVVAAHMVKHRDFFAAVKKAVKFTERAVVLSCKAEVPATDGLCFEPLLSRL